MFQLTAENAVDYLRRLGRLPEGPASAAVMSGGVSNQVVRVETIEGLMVLKQSRPQLRTRDEWFSDLDRIYREQEVMQALESLLPALVVPQVLFVDRPSFIYAMSHAPSDAQVWKAQLLEGRIDLVRGEQAGRILGMIHELSAQNAPRFEAFRGQAVFVQLRVDPFYRRIQERRPEVADAVGKLIEEMRTRAEALCHGDFTPKNLLAHATGFTLVDYETAHFGEPAMDLGLFLAHLTLKALRRPCLRQNFFELMRRFWQAYQAEIRYCPCVELETRGVRHLGANLLARIDGTSPVEYLPSEGRRETIRRLGRGILWGEWPSFENVWNWCDEAFAPFAEGDEV